jgi:hypothetical protein
VAPPFFVLRFLVEAACAWTSCEALSPLFKRSSRPEYVRSGFATCRSGRAEIIRCAITTRLRWRRNETRSLSLISRPRVNSGTARILPGTTGLTPRPGNLRVLAGELLKSIIEWSKIEYPAEAIGTSVAHQSFDMRFSNGWIRG